ncbi:ArsR family transcriptional regulator [Euzebya tangerina]|uniref:arsenate reductase/protein-tyrosine-phosphatase family protein n=1 Tax=Euzebya tangerina TaxID=591198 RepID=UPI0039C89D48
MTFSEAARLTGLRGNRLAHHLKVLEDADLVRRHTSEGDRRRRYLQLDRSRVSQLTVGVPMPGQSVVFVCTHNSARSPFAAGLWTNIVGDQARSAGCQPASRVHPIAVEIARDFGVDLSVVRPQGYDQVSLDSALVISVCDRANEAGAWPARRRWHWSVPDPRQVGTAAAFRTAFTEIDQRIRAVAAGAASQPNRHEGRTPP